jgi:hypothetical protein
MARAPGGPRPAPVFAESAGEPECIGRTESHRPKHAGTLLDAENQRPVEFGRQRPQAGTGRLLVSARACTAI